MLQTSQTKRNNNAMHHRCRVCMEGEGVMYSFNLSHILLQQCFAWLKQRIPLSKVYPCC